MPATSIILFVPDEQLPRGMASGPESPFRSWQRLRQSKRRSRFLRWAAVVTIPVVVAILVLIIVSLHPWRRPRRTSVPKPPPDTLCLISGCVVQSGEVMFRALGRAGINDPEATRIIAALRDAGFNFRQMRPGDSVTVLGRGGIPQRLLYERNYENVWRIDTDSGPVRASMLLRNVHSHLDVIKGAINSSLYETLVGLGESVDLVAEFTDMFGWEVDFFSEVQPLDSFAILVERRFGEGRFVGYGPILYAWYSGQVGAFRGFRFSDAGGRAGWYNEQGQSLRKTFLKSPLRFSRVSSFFGRRFHPIRRVVRQHAGIDYVAPTGTPVECICDGQVVSAGRSGGYGNLVVVGHPQGYQTRYGHLSRYGRSVRRGALVKQGEVVGYVGSTGLSTGPHLHFEVRKFGSAVNPLRLDAPRLDPVRKNDKPAFFELRDSLARLLDSLDRARQPLPAQAQR